MLTVRLPDTLRPERTHAARLVFGALLGLEYRVVFEGRADVAVGVDDAPGQLLRMPDVLFAGVENGWPRDAMPPPASPVRIDLSVGEAHASDLPVLYGLAPESGSWFSRTTYGAWFAIDVLGTAFWMMTRFEELLDPVRDQHERFAGCSSHAVRAGYIARPIVDETVLLLGAALQQLWPALQLGLPAPRLTPTHDVDRPFKYLFQTPVRLVRGMAADLVRGRGAATAAAAPARWRNVRRGRDDADPFFTFEWLMDSSEAAGLRSAFYFICGHSGGRLDGDYDIAHPRMRALLRRIHSRGHEIGLHGSYNSFRSAAVFGEELRKLRTICEQEGIRQEHFGGRQHVLRFDCAATPAVWQSAGLSYDSTLGYADVSGFRCGTCRPFPLFDHLARHTLDVIERPLICMDVTLLESRYEGRSQRAAQQRLTELSAQCGRVGGNFVLLWHNCHLVSAEQRETYRHAVSGSVGGELSGCAAQ